MAEVKIRWVDKVTQEINERTFEGENAGYEVMREESAYFTRVWAGKETLLVPTYSVLELSLKA